MKRVLLCLALLAGCAPLPHDVTLTSHFVWLGDGEDFGGLSGLEVLDGGSRYVAINDRGVIRSGPIEREDGQITGMPVDQRNLFLRMNGRAVSRKNNDSEGLAIGQDGLTYVSFEGATRVVAYDDRAAPPVRIFRNPVFRDLALNASLESLAIDDSGTLYAIPERSGRANRPFPVYRFQEGSGWDTAFQLPRRGSFLIVGADIGPDEMLYVLERDFTGVGFRSRVRRFDLMGGSEEVLLQTANGTHDNLEGISIWQSPDDGLVMTLISDDNFRFFQRTEVVEYRIDR